jgi:hypothetical protein
MELSTVLCRPFYSKTMSIDHFDEQRVARWRYRKILSLFSWEYVVRVDGQWVSPDFLAQRMLVETAAALFVYKNRTSHTVSHSPKCTVKSVQHAIISHLYADYPYLLPLYHLLVEQKHKNFSWTGPAISIRRRSQYLKRCARNLVIKPPTNQSCLKLIVKMTSPKVNSEMDTEMIEDITSSDPKHRRSSSGDKVGESKRSRVA